MAGLRCLIGNTSTEVFAAFANSLHISPRLLRPDPVLPGPISRTSEQTGLPNSGKLVWPCPWAVLIVS